MRRHGALHKHLPTGSHVESKLVSKLEWYCVAWAPAQTASCSGILLSDCLKTSQGTHGLSREPHHKRELQLQLWTIIDATELLSTLWWTIRSLLGPRGYHWAALSPESYACVEEMIDLFMSEVWECFSKVQQVQQRQPMQQRPHEPRPCNNNVALRVPAPDARSLAIVSASWDGTYHDAPTQYAWFFKSFLPCCCPRPSLCLYPSELWGLSSACITCVGSTLASIWPLLTQTWHLSMGCDTVGGTWEHQPEPDTSLAAEMSLEFIFEELGEKRQCNTQKNLGELISVELPDKKQLPCSNRIARKFPGEFQFYIRPDDQILVIIPWAFFLKHLNLLWTSQRSLS